MPAPIHAPAPTRRHLPTLAVACLLALLSIPTQAQPDGPFLGIINQNNTPVRAGAGNAYYVVGTLEAGTPVEVEEVFYRWYKIKPTEGMYSYISKAFVDLEGDGSRGIINNDRVDAKAGALKGPAESYRIQVRLNKFDIVRVLGEDGSFYKVVPPPNAFVYVPPESVRVATDTEIAQLRNPAPAAPPAPPAPEPTPEPVAPAPPAPGPVAPTPEPEPVTPPTPTSPPAPTPEPAETITQLPEPAPIPVVPDPAPEAPEPVAPPAPDPNAPLPSAAAPDAPITTPAVADPLKALEMELLPLFALPLDQQPYDQMIAGYTEIKANPALTKVDRLIVERRLIAIERNQRVAQALLRLKAAKSDATAAPLTDIPADDTTPSTFDAIGILTVSSVYDGQNVPRLYRLVAPNGRRTLAYVEPTPALRVNDNLGRLLGVSGTSSYDPAVKLEVLRPTRAVPLTPEGTPE
ncbi:MAG: SH3 domain-containing protein [Planctomycetota bacterium]